MQHFAALVPDGCGRLGNEQAARRSGELDAPAPVFTGNIVMVSGRVVGVEAELETALAGQCAVAAATVAACLGQHRQHVVPKAQFAIVLGGGREGQREEQQRLAKCNS